MPVDDRPDVTIVSQIGRETIPGTAVPADRFLPTFSFMPHLKRVTKQFRAGGSKYETASVRHTQHAEGSYDGILDYNSLMYILNGLTVPTTAPAAIAVSTGFLWQWRPLVRQLDNPHSYTIEVGDSIAVDQFANCRPSSMTVQLNQSDNKVSGNLLAQTMKTEQTQTATLNEKQRIVIAAGTTAGTFTLTVTAHASTQTTAPIAYNASADDLAGALVALTNIAAGDIQVTGGPGVTAPIAVEFLGTLAGLNIAQMTADSTLLTGGATHTATVTTTQNGGGAGVTIIPERPVERGQVDVFLDTTFAGIGVTQIASPFDEELQLGQKIKPKFVHNSTYKSFQSAIEVAPSLVYSFTTEYNAWGRALLTNILANDPVMYLRIRAKGLDLSNAVDGSVTELVQFDLAGKFTEPEVIKDVTGSGVFGYKFHLVALDDPDMGRPWQVDMQNSRASL